MITDHTRTGESAQREKRHDVYYNYYRQHQHPVALQLKQRVVQLAAAEVLFSDNKMNTRNKIMR